MAPTERYLEQRCAKWASEAYGIENVKLDLAARDWPDRCFFLPHGKIWLVEFKLPGETPRTRQIVVHNRLAALGHPVSVITSYADFLAELVRRTAG